MRCATSGRHGVPFLAHAHWEGDVFVSVPNDIEYTGSDTYYHLEVARTGSVREGLGFGSGLGSGVFLSLVELRDPCI